MACADQNSSMNVTGFGKTLRKGKIKCDLVCISQDLKWRLQIHCVCI